MAGKRAGYGRTFGDTPETIIDTIAGDLADNAIPVWDDEGSTLENSGLVLDEDTSSITTTLNFRTTGDIESGTGTFLLRSAHEISSGGENVPFTNSVTGISYHPTWQTTTRGGNWSSVQRTPVGDLVENHPIQNDDSQNITNPVYDFDGLNINHRIYRAVFGVGSDQTNVSVILSIRRGVDYVEYYRDTIPRITADAMAEYVLRPFVDISANQSFRLTVFSPDGDVVLKGNSSGEPFLLIDYVQWRDDPLATHPYVGNYRTDGLVNITENTVITADNVSTYQNKIWVIQGGNNPNVTISDGVDLTYFGFYANHASGRFTIRREQDGVTTFDGQMRERFRRGRGSFFVRIAENTFVELEDTPITGTFLELNDTPAAFGTAGQIVAVNTDANALEFITPPAGTFLDLTDTPAAFTANRFLQVNAAGSALGLVTNP